MSDQEDIENYTCGISDGYDFEGDSEIFLQHTINIRADIDMDLQNAKQCEDLQEGEILKKNARKQVFYLRGLLAGRKLIERESFKVEKGEKSQKYLIANPEKDNVPQFLAGFKHGYWLQRTDNPQLKSIMQNAPGDKEYFEGLLTGSKEAIRDQVQLEFDIMEAVKQREKDDHELDIG